MIYSIIKNDWMILKWEKIEAYNITYYLWVKTKEKKQQIFNAVKIFRENMWVIEYFDFPNI